jgi:plasmid stabilization system protein ParE
MKCRVSFSPEAELDLFEASDWYEFERPGLGDEFITHVKLKLHDIAERPLSFPEIEPEIHRSMVQRFPYGIYYTVVNQEIGVIAIVHGSRNPDHWKRLKKP